MARLDASSARSAISLVLATCSAGAAVAQTVDGGTMPPSEATATHEGRDGLSDILVTARRRPESLQQVPISATVFTGRELAARGATNVKDLLTITPSVSLPDLTGATNNVDIVIRGISTNTRNAGFDSGVGVYIDGVYAGRSNGVALTLAGIDSVEVLRGPQGTNFGKNTTAGAINIRTLQPVRDTVQYGSELQYGSYHDALGNAYVNLPLGDAVALRATVYGEQSNGFVKNVYNGQHYADQGYWGGRLQTKFWLGDRADLTLSGDYRRDNHFVNYPEVIREGSGKGVANLFTVPPGTVVVVPGPYTENVDFAPTERARRGGLNATLNYDLGSGYTLTSISGFRSNRTRDTADNDNGSDPTFVGTAHVIAIDNTRHFSEEVRVTSPSTGPFTFTAGGYYLNLKVNSFKTVTFPPPDTISVYGNVHNFNEALFFDSQLKPLPGLRLNAGIRYTHERKVLDRYSQISTGGGYTFIFPTFTAENGKLVTDKFTPTLGVSYDITRDIHSYFTFSRGYKSGGWNLDYASGLLTAAPRFKDERVDNYEVGLKTALFDNRVRLNLALFDMQFSDQQVQQQIGVAFNITNAGKSRSRGIESDFAYQANDYIRVSGGFGYVDARYQDFTNCAGTIDCSGNRLVNAPKWTGSVAVDVRAPISAWGDITGHIEYSYRSNFYAAVYNGERDATIGTDALLVRPYDDVSLSVGIKPKAQAWEASVFVKNLLDRANESGRYIDTLVDVNTLTANYFPPRTWGLRLAYNFSSK